MEQPDEDDIMEWEGEGGRILPDNKGNHIMEEPYGEAEKLVVEKHVGRVIEARRFETFSASMDALIPGYPNELAQEYARRWHSLRPAVADFATVMEGKLRQNDHKGHWHDADPRHLMDRIVEEYYELWESLADGNVTAIQKECADVANFCMMIADIVGHRTRKQIQASMSGEQ